MSNTRIALTGIFSVIKNLEVGGSQIRYRLAVIGYKDIHPNLLGCNGNSLFLGGSGQGSGCDKHRQQHYLTLYHR
jgi:hypothetical protein